MLIRASIALTSISIIDKFGQVIAVPFPKRKARPTGNTISGEQTFIHPCLSEQLVPSVINRGPKHERELNTVYTPQETHDIATDSELPLTPFVQLSPAINQEARINAFFLKQAFGKQFPALTPVVKTNTVATSAAANTGDSTPGKDNTSMTVTSSWWETCTDWDDPIIGCEFIRLCNNRVGNTDTCSGIIINYADSALQFFTHDGTFYTSLLFGGPTGTIESLKWLPFDAPPPAQAQVSPQLEALIAKMSDKKDNAGATYLKALWEIVRSAIPSMPFPPSEYSGYANAIVGKPLALVNVGWSLELAQAPLWPQHTLPPPQKDPGKNDTIDPLRVDAQKEMSSYQFKVKIGDSDRPFDGVVAYWDTENVNTETRDNPSSSTRTDFSTIWSYSTSDLAKKVGQLIEPSKFPTMTPYFIHPNSVPDATTFSQQHAAKFMVKTLLIDPYTPIHLYSGILPIKSLRLPSWTIQQALKNMSKFCLSKTLTVHADRRLRSCFLYSRSDIDSTRCTKGVRSEPPSEGRYMDAITCHITRQRAYTD